MIKVNYTIERMPGAQLNDVYYIAITKDCNTQYRVVCNGTFTVVPGTAAKAIEGEIFMRVNKGYSNSFPMITIECDHKVH